MQGESEPSKDSSESPRPAFQISDSTIRECPFCGQMTDVVDDGFGHGILTEHHMKFPNVRCSGSRLIVKGEIVLREPSQELEEAPGEASGPLDGWL